jgi:hypothetical protein
MAAENAKTFLRIPVYLSVIVTEFTSSTTYQYLGRDVPKLVQGLPSFPYLFISVI